MKIAYVELCEELNMEVVVPASKCVDVVVAVLLSRATSPSDVQFSSIPGNIGQL